MRIPVDDLGLDNVVPGAEWRLNITRNKEHNHSTWAAVGGNFHNPSAFGKLFTCPFETWLKQVRDSRNQRAGVLLSAAADSQAACKARLATIAEFADNTLARPDPGATDWIDVTRAYSRAGFVEHAYRCIERENEYCRMFRQARNLNSP
jgi:hypothetical protein